MKGESGWKELGRGLLDSNGDAEHRQEDVPFSHAGKGATPEVHGAQEVSRDGDVPGGVEGNTPAILTAHIPEGLAPEVTQLGLKLWRVVSPGGCRDNVRKRREGEKNYDSQN